MALTRVRQQQLITTIAGFDDAIVPLNDAITGINTSDIGFIFKRGTLPNAGIIWDEANDTFRVLLTTDSGTTDSITANITNASFRAGNITATSVVASTFTGSLTGNATSASYLESARTINGVRFDGTADIVITAAADTVTASTLNGDTLSANVLYSSLTSVGTLVSLVVTSSVQAKDITLTGNLNVGGTVTTTGATNLSVANSIIYLAEGNTADLVDSGFVQTHVDGIELHTGLVRDASDGVFKFFGNVTAEPSTVIDFTTASYLPVKMGDLTANAASFSNDVTANLFKGNVDLSKVAGSGILIEGAYCWKDLIGDITPRAGTSAAPLLKNFIDNVRDWSYSANDAGDTRFHMPHDYMPGSDMFIHVHWAHNGTDIIGEFNVEFYATYAKGHQQAAFSSTVNPTVTVANLSIVNCPQYMHRIDEVQLSAIGGGTTRLNTSNLEVDGIILINYVVTSIPSIIGSISTNTPFIFNIDLHYQSTNVGTKNKAPSFYA